MYKRELSPSGIHGIVNFGHTYYKRIDECRIINYTILPYVIECILSFYEDDCFYAFLFMLAVEILRRKCVDLMRKRRQTVQPRYEENRQAAKLPTVICTTLDQIESTR